MSSEMAEPREIRRTGWTMPCPHCRSDIRYTLLTNQRAPTPFFYAQPGNHVLLREEDQARVDALYASSGGKAPPLERLAATWASIVEEAPEAPGGGSFGLWTYVTCPHCGEALTYDGGRQDLNRRIHEPKIVLIDGALLVGGDADRTTRIRVQLRDGSA